jgi:hypothetical protein
MLFDFGPWALSSARWFLAAPGDLSSDCVAFMSDEGFDWAAAFPRSEDGAPCWALEPGCSRFPVPCALAKPAPAISATAATDIIKRLIIECLLRCFHCPRRLTKREAPCSAISPVPPTLFCEAEMNGFAAKITQN